MQIMIDMREFVFGIGELFAELMMAALARSENCWLWRRGGGCPTPVGGADVPPSS